MTTKKNETQTEITSSKRQKSEESRQQRQKVHNLDRQVNLLHSLSLYDNLKLNKNFWVNKNKSANNLKLGYNNKPTHQPPPTGQQQTNQQTSTAIASKEVDEFTPIDGHSASSTAPINYVLYIPGQDDYIKIPMYNDDGEKTESELYSLLANNQLLNTDTPLRAQKNFSRLPTPGRPTFS